MKLVLEAIKAVLMWIPIIVLTLLGLVAGLFVVPVALFGVPMLPKNVVKWSKINLPSWAYLWDNLRDGVLGDRRLDYWHNGKQYPVWFDKLPLSQYVKAYYWLAIRNPANTLKRYVPFMGCQVGLEKVTGYSTVATHRPRKIINVLAGQAFVSDTKDVEGYQFVKASAEGELLSYWGFYLYKRVSPTRYLMIRLGHKIEPRYTFEKFVGDRASKAWKGTTFRIALRGIRK